MIYNCTIIYIRFWQIYHEDDTKSTIISSITGTTGSTKNDNNDIPIVQVTNTTELAIDVNEEDEATKMGIVEKLFWM